jgi:uncharacterized protein involved in response to NO
MSPIPRLRAYLGPALLSYGFRPFFLLGATYAGLGIAIWLPLLFGDIRIPTALSPLDWHVHEMLYGYVPAVMTGFLLTAIPNWTGRLPLQGGPLAALVALWIVGRIAVCLSQPVGALVAGVIDCSFLLFVAAAAAREVVAGRNWRNLPPVALVLIFFAGNVVFHVEDRLSGIAAFGTRIGIAAAIALISLIGGRVIPSFTHNWLTRENPGRLPAPFGQFDVAVLAVSVAALVVWIALPSWPGTAALLLVAGIGQAVRLLRWSGDRTLRDALVFVLHVGYAFVPAGFVIVAGAIVLPRAIALSAGLHAWTVGAVGTMTLAIMTRASLGHTGRALAAGRLTQAIYVLVVAAAVLRIAAAFAPATTALLHTAAAAWIAAFWLFAVGYGPALFQPRRAAR